MFNCKAVYMEMFRLPRRGWRNTRTLERGRPDAGQDSFTAGAENCIPEKESNIQFGCHASLPIKSRGCKESKGDGRRRRGGTCALTTTVGAPAEQLNESNGKRIWCSCDGGL